MKNVLISTLAAGAILVSGAAFANDLVSENPSFFLNVEQQLQAESVASTSDINSAPAKTSIFDGTFGSSDPR